MEPPIKVAIVDDHAIARYGIEQILARQPGFAVVCSVGSLAELELDAVRPDIVVLDLMLGESRVAPGQVKELCARYRVLMLSANARYRDIINAEQAGASYLAKAAADEDYIDAIRVVAAGGRYLSRQLADVIAAVDARYPGGIPALSSRERDILNCIAQGLTYRKTANELGISENTVPDYIKRIHDKIGPGTMAHTMLTAIILGEIDPEVIHGAQGNVQSDRA